MFYTAFDSLFWSCAWFFSIFSFVTYKTILLRYLVFGKVIFKLSFKHARIGGFFQEDYKLHTFPNVRTQKNHNLFVSLQKRKVWFNTVIAIRMKSWPSWMKSILSKLKEQENIWVVPSEKAKIWCVKITNLVWFLCDLVCTISSCSLYSSIKNKHIHR